MHNKIYSFVLVGRLQCRSCKRHNNPAALALITFRRPYTCRSTWQASVGIFSSFLKPQLGQVIVDSKVILFPILLLFIAAGFTAFQIGTSKVLLLMQQCK